MENKPTAVDFLAQEIGLISKEKAILQEALYAANKRNQELEQELAQYKQKEKEVQ